MSLWQCKIFLFVAVYYRCIPSPDVNYTEIANTYKTKDVNSEMIKKSVQNLISPDEFTQVSLLFLLPINVELMYAKEIPNVINEGHSLPIMG
jgi:hypothetical protein